MILPISDIKDQLREVFGDEVQFNKLPDSDRVYCATRAKFITSWHQRFWLPYKRNRKLQSKGTFNPGMCDAFARLAQAEYSFLINRKFASLNYGDIGSSLFRADVHIPTGSTLNGVPAGPHSTNLIVFDEGNKVGNIYFYEPQSTETRPTLTGIEQARNENWIGLYRVDC